MIVFPYNTRVMKSLNEDLKTGQFKQIYLLYGEESYLKRQYRERLVRAMIPEGDTMNYAHYEGKNIPVKEVIDLAETMPFLRKKGSSYLKIPDFSRLRQEQNWQIISKRCRRQPILFL